MKTIAEIRNNVEGFAKLEHKYNLYALQVERLDDRIESDDIVPMWILEKRAKK